MAGGCGHHRGRHPIRLRDTRRLAHGGVGLRSHHELPQSDRVVAIQAARGSSVIEWSRCADECVDCDALTLRGLHMALHVVGPLDAQAG